MSRRSIVWPVIALLAGACSGTADPVASTAPPVATSATVSTTVAVPSSSPATTNTEVAATTSTSVPSDELPGWDSWTLIYASLDTGSHQRDEAEQIATSIEGAGVLLSDDYPSLNTGYWVVYSGEWGNRATAGIWCPDGLDPSLTCYPRYLGDRAATLLDAGHAVAQLDGKLVILEPATGEVVQTLSDDFHNEAEFPGRFALDRAESDLYFSLGFEDSWYSCESEKAEVRRLDLETGEEGLVGDGWSPAISPDGRWLALVAASDCYPDPEVGEWFVAPGSQVEIYDLAADRFDPVRVLQMETPATVYGDDAEVYAVFWDAGSEHLLVVLGDHTVRRVAPDATGWLSDAPVEFETGDPLLVAVTAESFFFQSYYDELYVINEIDRSSGAVKATFEIDGYWAAVAVNGEGAALIGATDMLVLPGGDTVAVAGVVHNLAW